MTNYENLLTLTVEEMSRFFAELGGGGNSFCPCPCQYNQLFKTGRDGCDRQPEVLDNCEDGVLKWLSRITEDCWTDSTLFSMARSGGRREGAG